VLAEKVKAVKQQLKAMKEWWQFLTYLYISLAQNV